MVEVPLQHNDSERSLLQWARFYYDRGLNPIPLEPSCSSCGDPDHGKRPRVKWEGYQTRRVSDAEIEKWFGKRPSNLGLVCGGISGNLVVQDFEDYRSYLQFYPGHEDLESSTLVTRTPGGGVHVYWFSVKSVRRSIRFSKEPPLDLLGEKGYVAAAPSVVHGRPYSIVSTTNICLASGDVFEVTWKRCRELEWRTPGAGALPFRDILAGVPEGYRNESAFRYARHLLFKVKLDRDTVWFELQRWNSHNAPPLSERELETILQSASRYGSKGVKIWRWRSRVD